MVPAAVQVRTAADITGAMVQADMEAHVDRSEAPRSARGKLASEITARIIAAGQVEPELPATIERSDDHDESGREGLLDENDRPMPELA